MAPLFVIVLSLAAGAATYVATVRAGRRIPAAVGFDGPSSGAGAVALGSEPAVEPTPSDDEAESVKAEETDAEIVDLDAARAPATDGTEDADGAGEAGAEAATEPDDATIEDTAGAGLPLAPVVVTAASVPAPEPGYAYLKVSTKRTSWRDRIAGLVGIAILLVLGSAAIAFGIYQLGSGLNALLQRFLNG